MKENQNPLSLLLEFNFGYTLDRASIKLFSFFPDLGFYYAHYHGVTDLLSHIII